MKTTSGTTGPPVPIWYSPEFYFDLFLLTVPKILLRHRGEVAPPEERPVLCVAVTDNRSCSDFVAADPTGATGLTTQVVVDEARPATIRRLWRLLEELEPGCVTAKPSILEVLLEHRDALAPLARPPDLVVSSGAELAEPIRAAAADLFAAPVAISYGLTEFGLVASECAFRRGLHVDHGTLAAELVDGELVLSSVENRAMPLLRYRTGDLAELDDGPCPCGSREPRISSLHGRRVVCFRFADGELVSPTHFNDLFARFPLREFQMTQHAVDRLEVLVEPTDERAGVARAICEHVQGRLPNGVGVEVRTTAFDRSSKFERYRSLVG